jgi:hypothetical protein
MTVILGVVKRKFNNKSGTANAEAFVSLIRDGSFFILKRRESI